MGVLTDLVAVKESEIESVAESTSPAFDFGGIDAKGIDQVKLCKLKSILEQQPYQRSCVGEFELLAGDEEEGPWVFRVPTDLVKLVASLHGVALSQVSGQWAAAEEFKLDGWSPQDVEATLVEIVNLCSSAVAEQKMLVMWMSV